MAKKKRNPLDNVNTHDYLHYTYLNDASKWNWIPTCVSCKERMNVGGVCIVGNGYHDMPYLYICKECKEVMITKLQASEGTHV